MDLTINWKPEQNLLQKLILSHIKQDNPLK